MRTTEPGQLGSEIASFRRGRQTLSDGQQRAACSMQHLRGTWRRLEKKERLWCPGAGELRGGSKNAGGRSLYSAKRNRHNRWAGAHPHTHTRHRVGPKVEGRGRGKGDRQMNADGGQRESTPKHLAGSTLCKGHGRRDKPASARWPLPGPRIHGAWAGQPVLRWHPRWLAGRCERVQT